MKFDSDRFDEGVFPKRRPWFMILLVAAIAAFPAYRLALFVYNRLQPRAGIESHVNPSAVGTTTRNDSSLPVRKPVLPERPVVGTPAAVQQPAAAIAAGVGPAAPPANSVSTASRRTDVNLSAATQALTPEQVREVLTKGQALEDRGDMLGAVKTYAEAMKSCGVGRLRSVLEDRFGRANVGLLLSRQKMPRKVEYVVKPNDAVEKIARKFGTTKELIAGINGLGGGHVIRNGQTLMVFNGRFAIAINKSRYELLLELDGEFFKRYSVCIGAENKTPAGSFVITSREINPTWWPEGKGSIPSGDERNLLGTRWMAMKDKLDPAKDRRGLGIHGTRDEISIGKALSAGCIRMLNADVEELHMLVPVGTPVTVVE